MKTIYFLPAIRAEQTNFLLKQTNKQILVNILGNARMEITDI